MAKSLFDAATVATANLLEQAPAAAVGIVSKALIDSGALKQILFAMDAGQQVSKNRPQPASVRAARIKFSISCRGNASLAG